LLVDRVRRTSIVSDSAGLVRDLARGEVDEVAALARVVPDTIRAWAKAGRLPSKRLGKKLLFPRVATMKCLGLGDDQGQEVPA